MSLLVALAIISEGVAVWPPAVQAEASLPSVRNVLAPTGKLRIGVAPRSSCSIADDITAIHLGEELARRLNVPSETAVYADTAELAAGVKTGVVDFAVTVVTPALVDLVDFSPALRIQELGFVVPIGSPIRSIADIDKAGHRIGVMRWCPFADRLKKVLTKAAVVYPTEHLGTDAYWPEQWDAKAVVTSDIKPSVWTRHVRVVEGHWGVQHMAIAIPQGRGASHDYLRRFVEDVQQSGLLARVIAKAWPSETTKP
jgi:polar amino acid transport system substrate-binding protein